MHSGTFYEPSNPDDIQKAIDHLLSLKAAALAAKGANPPAPAQPTGPAWQPPTLERVLKELLPTKTGERLRAWVLNTTPGQQLHMAEIAKLFGLASVRQVVALIAKLEQTSSHRSITVLVRTGDRYEMPKDVLDTLKRLIEAEKKDKPDAGAAGAAA
jgi:hypothetical protein